MPLYFYISDYASVTDCQDSTKMKTAAVFKIDKTA